MHAKPDLRVFLKWKFTCPGSVIAAVIPLDFQKTMAFHFEFEHGERMTADSYDDDVALRCYVRQHRRDLMTALERRVTEYTAPIVSESSHHEIGKHLHRKVALLYEYLERRDGHVDDGAVIAAFQLPHATRSKNAVSRVIEEQRTQINENRCPICNCIVRTPAARQCLWCGHAWH